MVDDRITVVIGNDLKKKLKIHCANNKTNITDFIKKLIEQNIK